MTEKKNKKNQTKTKQNKTKKKNERKKVLLIKRRIHALCVKIGTCSLGL